jgi:hypothetical protein
LKSSLENTLRASYRDLVAESGRMSPSDRALAAFGSRIGSEPGESPDDSWLPRQRHPDRGELAAVCRAISRIVETLGPASRCARTALDLAPRADPHLSEASQVLSQLLAGVRDRVIDRDDADRLVVLAGQSITEAAIQINGARRGYRRRHRRPLDRAFSDAAGAAWDLKALRPRVTRLFDDSENAGAAAPASYDPA